MEEVSHPSQSDVEQPHTPVNHSRPFFYVQPPSQPYFMYQWPVDSFGQYAFPVPVFPFGRPCMPPYQYMQYPGYVVPHAPMQPTDYRRIAPLFPSVASYDLRFRQHFQQMSMHGRETMSSEAQTEPGDPVSKLMEHLEGLQACEKSGMVKEPTVMVSSTPALISHTQEVKMNYGDDELKTEPPPSLEANQDDLMKPVTPCDSAVFDTELSQGGLEECVLSDVLPLDSSSVHDNSQSLHQDYRRCDSERLCFQSEKSGTSHVGNESHSAEVQDSGAHVSDCNGTSDLYEGKTSIISENLPLDSVEVTEPLFQMTADCDLPYQILHLPCNTTTTSLLQKDPLLYMDTPSSKRDAFGSPYTHSYYPQVVPERQSVLSPSLDELSSRDEMFSTDVEDDLTSGQVYVEGGKLEERGAVPTHSEMDPVDKACSAWAKTCACCGASLPDGGLGPAELLDQDCELEEDAEMPNTVDAQKVLRQHLTRYSLPVCTQVSKHKSRKVLEVGEPSGQDQDHGRGECGEWPYPAAKGDKIRGKGQKSTQFRSYSEHFQRECSGEILDQENWTGCGSKQRSRLCRPVSGLQEKGRSARRRPSCKTFAQQRPRRNEYDDQNEAEFSYCQRGRGSTKRRGTRY